MNRINNEQQNRYNDDLCNASSCLILMSTVLPDFLIKTISFHGNEVKLYEEYRFNAMT